MSEIRKEIDFELDMYRGNMNRIMVTHDYGELHEMYKVACARIVKISGLLNSLLNENLSRLRQDNEE